MVDDYFLFTVTSFFYAVAFFVIGPAVDLFNLSRIAVAGLRLISSVIFYSSFINWRSLFEKGYARK